MIRLFTLAFAFLLFVGNLMFFDLLHVSKQIKVESGVAYNKFFVRLGPNHLDHCDIQCNGFDHKYLHLLITIS